MYFSKSLLLALVALVFLAALMCEAKPRKRGKGILGRSERRLLQRYLRRAAKLQGAESSEIEEDEAQSPAELPDNVEDDTEYSKNLAVQDELFEVDIVLTKKQLEELNAELDGGRRRQKRKLTSSTRLRWQNKIVPYRIAIASSSAQSAIRAGIRNWEEETCLRFPERRNERDYMEFSAQSGCYSSIGRVGGRQTVSIGNGCATLGIVAHEIGHALGLWHEQSRPDRDEYIRVNSQNIQSSRLGQFSKRSPSSVVDFGIPYDLGSIMHYGPYGFSNGRGRAIDSRDSAFSTTFGQRNGLSFIDAKIINAAYCADVCPRRLNCLNGGYTDPKDCSKCRCPDGLSGNCDRAQPSSCGSDLIATSSWQTLSSPRLSPNQNCFWHIKSDDRSEIEIKTDQIDYPCREPCRSFVELKYNDDFEQTGARLCCDGIRQVRSEKGEVVVIHRTDSSTSSRYDGFRIQFRKVGGGPGTTPPPTPPPTTRATTRPVTTRRTTRPVTTRRTRPATTRRTTRITTPRPTQRTTRPSGSGWGEWSQWSRCSKPCGGCGSSFRTRKCLSRRRRDCRGRKREGRRCNQQPCSVGTVTKKAKCKFSAWIPCNYRGRTLVDPVTFKIELPDDWEAGTKGKVRRKKKDPRKGSLCKRCAANEFSTLIVAVKLFILGGFRTFVYGCHKKVPGKRKGVKKDGCCRRATLTAGVCRRR